MNIFRLWRVPLFALLAATLIFVSWIKLTEPKLSSLPKLANGDLVFQTDRSKQMLAILFATGSFYTHVGIIKMSRSGAPMVIDASRQVRCIPLADWINHGYGKRLLVMRMQGLTSSDSSRIVLAAEDYFGRPYDIFFTFGKDRIYCSELIYYAYHDGANIDLGHVQKVAELNMDNFAVRKIIQLRWHRDPVCEQDGPDDFSACFEKIMEQPIITPVSIARDPRLKLVYGNF